MGGQAATTYGFIGLGQMGHGMATNIRKKIPSTDHVIVYDVNPDAVSRMLDENAGTNIRGASSPKEIAEAADIVMTSVPQARHVEDVFLNPDKGLLAAKPRPGQSTLFMELSTIEAGTSNKIDDLVSSGGWGEFVDAPCSGGFMGAESGSLTFMIGCSEELWPRVSGICSLMGKEGGILRCGNRGSGLKMKLLNNYLSSLTAHATAETYNIGLRAGLDPRRLNEVLNAGSAMSFNSKVNNPVPGMNPGAAASKGYNGGFSLELCLGVLELSLKTAKDLGASTILGEPMIATLREMAKDPQYHGKDSKVLYKYIGGEDPIFKE